MARKFKTMDGNNAAAYVSYAFTEVAGIYPITPSSPMADYVDQCHRFTNNITVLYDGDAAGIKAALRGIDMLLEEGSVKLRIQTSPTDKPLHRLEDSCRILSFFLLVDSDDKVWPMVAPGAPINECFDGKDFESKNK